MYDGISRLRVSKESFWIAGAWVVQEEKRRIYDGMNVVQERDGTNAVTCSYTRGSDMGGGIGGLLARSTPAGDFYYHYDGRGNVTQMTDANQVTVASYKYSAFGSLIASSGAQASNNPYRFSTKEFHSNTGLYDYGYRFFSPGLGRWLNRDPIAEMGGVNLYGFVKNNPVYEIDYWGLCGGGAMGCLKEIGATTLTLGALVIAGGKVGLDISITSSAVAAEILLVPETAGISLIPVEITVAIGVGKTAWDVADFYWKGLQFLTAVGFLIACLRPCSPPVMVTIPPPPAPPVTPPPTTYKPFPKGTKQ